MPPTVQRTLGNQEGAFSKVLWGKECAHVCVLRWCTSPVGGVTPPRSRNVLLLARCIRFFVFFSKYHCCVCVYAGLCALWITCLWAIKRMQERTSVLACISRVWPLTIVCKTSRCGGFRSFFSSRQSKHVTGWTAERLAAWEHRVIHS